MTTQAQVDKRVGTHVRDRVSVLHRDEDNLAVDTTVPRYDLSSSTLSAAIYVPAGTQHVPAGKQLDLVRVTGTLQSTDNTTLKEMYGYVFNMVNDSTVGDTSNDYNRVRGLIGEITTNGPGSVRAIHVTAIGATASTGVVNGANIQVAPSATNVPSRALQISNTGSTDLVDAIFFDSNNDTNRFKGGLNMAERGSYALWAIALTASSMSGKVFWQDGTFLSHYGTGLEFNVNSGALGIKMVSLPSTDPGVLNQVFMTTRLTSSGAVLAISTGP